MSIIQVVVADDFHYGDDALVLTMDGIGLHAFTDALRDAAWNGRARLAHAGQSHEFVIAPGLPMSRSAPTGWCGI